MILSTVFLAKVLLAVGTVVIFFHEFRDRLSRRWLAYITAAILICAVAVNYAVSFLPPMTEEVTLTALGEKQEAAKGMEVYLSGYTIDGKSYISGKSLEIVEGKWFWKGEIYTWRPETDSRQPEGTTRTVVLKIPVGWNRTLDFNSSQYRGKVEISTYEKQWTVDTYSEEGRINSEQIGRSRTTLLLLNQLRRLALYILVFLVLSFWGIRTVQWALEKPEQAREWLDRNSGKIAYGCIALVTFALMVHYADKYSLWYDCIATISFTCGTVAEAFYTCFNLYDYTPPFYNICATLWYHIAPYGQKWLLLISIVPTVLAIYLMGLIGEHLKGKYCGIFASIFIAFSTSVWLNAAYQYRSYSFLVFFSALTLYSYILKGENVKLSRIYFSLSLTGLAMSNYYGMLACAGYAIADLYLVYKKQSSMKRTIIPYIFPGVISISWVIGIIAITLQHREYKKIATWYPEPSGAEQVYDLLRFLSGNIDIFYYLFLISLSAAVIVCVQKTKSFSMDRFYLLFSTMQIICMVSIMLIYSNFVNRESPKWAERYFLVLIPQICIVLIYAFSGFIGFLKEESIKKNLQKVCCLSVGIITFLHCYHVIITPSEIKAITASGTTCVTEPYREAADWIYTQNNYIFNRDTVIIANDHYGAKRGTIEYYIERQGRRDPLNYYHNSEITADELINYNRIYFWKTSIPSSYQNVLKEFYELDTKKEDIRILVYQKKGT